MHRQERISGFMDSSDEGEVASEAADFGSESEGLLYSDTPIPGLESDNDELGLLRQSNETVRIPGVVDFLNNLAEPVIPPNIILGEE